ELTVDPKVNNEWERHDRAENILQQSDAKIEHVGGDKAAYYPIQDNIKLPQKGQFDTPDKYYATALHELGHWTGHASRLDRPLSNVFGSQDYAREELRAEIASYMVGMQLGIGHDPGQHLAYVDSWIRDLEDHPTEIFKACSDAEKIQSFVMNFEQEQKQNRNKEDTMEIVTAEGLTMEEIMGDTGSGYQPKNELTGKRYHLSRFVSFYANQELDAAGNINLELQQALRKNTAAGVLRFENAIEKNLAEQSKINMQELNRAGVDGVILTKDGKPFIAIATDKKQLHKGMYQAAKGLEKNYLAVPFADIDQAKQLGALWDKPAKTWYIPEGLDGKPFARWERGHSVTADNPQQQFADFIHGMGGNLQGETPQMDGKLHRIPEIGAKPGNKHIAYVGYLDGVPAGWVKNFRGGETKWKMTGVVLTDDDRARLKKEGQKKKTQREKDRQEIYTQKAKESKKITDKLTPATGKEAYFADKGISIKNPNVKIDPKGNIVVSMRDIFGKQWSHQTLQCNGFKQ
ncbi:MAG: hypothetical protein KAR13_04350, partial [Desulfobulbaceae bacterium]|nr:hypothetical protein [Desulfobulbaceae bacterium]